jgi:molybdopterin-guanine dinucleotide biosynthesis protein A
MTTGIVLTGGASRRMGADKAFVVVDGRPMAVAVADALWEGGCHPVECQGGDVEQLASLGLAAAADSRPGDGPVAAIVDALERAGSDIVVAACDLPELDGDTVRSLTAVREAPAAYARTGDRAHLVSAWSAGALSALRRLVDDGPASYRAALEEVGAVAVDVDPARVRNVNEPDDLAP